MLKETKIKNICLFFFNYLGFDGGPDSLTAKYASHLCPPPPMPPFKQGNDVEFNFSERRKLIRSNRCIHRDFSSCSTSSNNSVVSPTFLSDKKNKIILDEAAVLHKIQLPEFQENKCILPANVVTSESSSTINSNVVSCVSQQRTSLEMRLHDLYGVIHFIFLIILLIILYKD